MFDYCVIILSKLVRKLFLFLLVFVYKKNKVKFTQELLLKLVFFIS
jgi:hypothetical protein